VTTEDHVDMSQDPLDDWTLSRCHHCGDDLVDYEQPIYVHEEDGVRVECQGCGFSTPRQPTMELAADSWSFIFWMLRDAHRQGPRP
jgi:hypothetical protein